MLRKTLMVITVISLMTALAACGGPAATTAAPGQPPATQAPSTKAPTQPAEATPGGGLPVQGGAPGPEAITVDNLDRLNSLSQIPLPAFITALSFSPDSRLLAVGTSKGGAVFEVETQKQVATFAQDIPLFGLAWSPDSKLVAGLPGDPTHGKITIWNVGANAESDLLKGKLDGQVAFTFSPDGSQAASGGASGDVTIWNLLSGDPVTGFNATEAGADAGGGQPAISRLIFIGDGKTLAIGSVGAIEETLLWDLAANKALPKVSPVAHIAAPVATALFAPGDASHVYWWSRGDVVVVDIATDKETARLSTEDVIQSAAFTPDGKLLAAASAGSQNGVISPLIKLWNTTTGQDAKVLSGFTQIPTAMAFSPDGSRLALGIPGEGIALWGLVQNQ
jgi:WD40 repeat protein